MLIDPGATHSFIASGFVLDSDGIRAKLPEVMGVFTPMAGFYTVEYVHRQCEMKIRGHRFTIYLMPLEMFDFDALQRGWGWIG